MEILVDTNVLLRASQPNQPAGVSAINAMKSLRRQQHTLLLAPQNIIEFWNVCTRPGHVNGLGLSVGATERYVERLIRIFPVAIESPRIFEKWLALVVQHAVIGSRVHDARLVALMKDHDIEGILTFNVKDFSRYEGIRPIHPNEC